jgi:integrase
MARGHSRLSALAVGRAKKPGLYPDGQGLYLQVSPSGSTSWIFRYQHARRRRYMGLGGLAAVSLSDARRKALAARKMLAEGLDPLEEGRALAVARAAAAAKAITFRDAAARYIATHQSSWRNAKHIAQWGATLQAYAMPVFGDVSVAAIDTDLVLQVLEPIWGEKNETARRVRGRIEVILDWATAGKLRSGENPARWKGLLEHRLSKQSRSARVKHHPALDYRRMGAFMAKLRKQEGVAARCLEFTVLTGARTSESTGAGWSEFDLKGPLWTVPGDRIKAGRQHRVPLAARALAIVRDQAKSRVGEYVFGGRKPGMPLSNMAMATVLRRMGMNDITVHGFRSSLRDWAAEQTNYPREVAEMALAHAVGDKVEAAYRRGDLLEKRKQIMADWAKHCGSTRPSGSNDAVGHLLRSGKALPMQR